MLEQDKKTIEIMMNNQEKFTDKFLEWLPNNLHIWNAFAIEAAKIKNRGFKHYSSRTIVHFLRHHSALMEESSMWKIDNDISPYLSRLFDVRYPEMKGLWEYRATKRAYKDHMIRTEQIELEL
jgi:hypothetical protein